MTSVTNIRLRVLPRFPANLQGTNGITVVREGTGLIIKPDFGALAETSNIPNPAETLFLAWNRETDSYTSIAFQSMFDNSGSAAGFQTIAAAELASISPAVHAIELYGDATVGDGLGGLYIDTDNGSADTFVSGDGRTWYLAPDIGADRLTSSNLIELHYATLGAAGMTVLASSLASDVRNFLDTAPYVATRTALKALDPTKDTTALLSENGRGGIFNWVTGDGSALIAADPEEGVYLEADTVAATVGYWKRFFLGGHSPRWFGCVADDDAEDTEPFQACVDFIANTDPERKAIDLGNARYLVRNITIPEECLQLVMYGNGPYASQIRSETLLAGQVFLVYGQGCHFQDFRVQQDSSVSASFASTAVDVGADTCTVPSTTTKWRTGVKIQMTTTGVLPTGISAATDYYAIYVNATTIKLATSLANANLGTAIDITAAGSGTHTITATFDVSTLARDGFLLTKDYGVAVPECDIDAEFHNVEVSRFRYGVNCKGRGLRFENSLCSVSYHPIYLDYPSVGEYTPGPNVQEDLAGFRGIFITDNRFHSNISAAIANVGTNAAKINGLLIANNLVDIGRPLFYGHMGIGGSMIVGNIINETPLEGLNLTGGFDYLVIGNTISGSEGIAGGERIPDNFVKMTGTHDNGVFRGNLFKRCKSHGFDIRTGTATRIIITGNTFIDPCQDIGSFCPVAFVGANHTGMVYHNQVDTANALTGVVRTSDASANIEVGHHDFMNVAIPLAIGTSQKYHATLAEKGTWTPQLQFGAANVGMSISASGKWTRNGDQVVVSYLITLTTKGSSTGSATISGLASGAPLGVPGNANGVGPVMATGVAALTSTIQAQVASSGQIDLYDNGATGRASLDDTNFANGSIIRGSVAYHVS